MRSKLEQQDDFDTGAYKELQVLVELEATPDVTQRQLSQRVGIALGLTNALLRNLIKKGYLRSQQASWKRWVYSLTPAGAAHKISLTVNYIQRFLSHYRGVRQTLREELMPLDLNKESRIAIVGIGEFAELIYLGLKEIGINEMEFFCDQPDEGISFLGTLVLDVKELDPKYYDRIFVAGLEQPLNEGLMDVFDDENQVNKLVTLFNQKYMG